MNRRLLVSIALLALLSGFLWWSIRKNQQEQPTDGKLLPNLVRENIARIEMDLPEEGKIVLDRAGTQWLLPGWQNLPADPVYANFLVDTLISAPAGDVLTRKEEDLGRYGLAPPSRTLVLKDENGSVMHNLAFGSAREGYRSIYLRVDKGPVRQVNADFYPALNRPGWLDRNVWRLSANHVTRLHITGPDLSFVVEKKGDTWQSEDPLSDCFHEMVVPMLIHLRAGRSIYQPGEKLSGETYRVTVETSATTLSILLTPEERLVQGRRDQLPITYQFAPVFLERLRDCLANRP